MARKGIEDLEYQKFINIDVNKTAVRTFISDVNGNEALVNEDGQLHIVAEGKVYEEASTNTTLGANESYTSSPANILAYNALAIFVTADVAGTLYIQYSKDGLTNWRTAETYPIAAGDEKWYTPPAFGAYIKMIYTNGATEQTNFELTLVLRKMPIKWSSHNVTETIKDNDDAQLVKSVIAAKDELGNYANITANQVGVNVQSMNTTPIEKVYAPFLSRFRKVYVATGYTTVASAISKNDTVITVVDGTKMTTGHVIALWTAGGGAFYTGIILGVTGNDVTLDTPIPTTFPVGASASSGATDLAVNGATTPQIFKVRQPDMPVLATGVEVVIHRMIFQCYTVGAVDSLTKFGDLTALSKGLFMRHEKTNANNIFNVKTNADIRSIAFDFDEFTALGNNQDGFTSRLTFGGNSKIGTSILLKDGEALEMWVQDDLSGLDKLEIMVGGFIRPVF